MTSRGRESTRGDGFEPETEFRWICPYCGMSRRTRYAMDGEKAEANAVSALRSHVANAEGDGHGPRNELPADRDRTLFAYVCCVDG